MASINDNYVQWSNYDWPKGGDEWSSTWGGTDFLWWGSIYPRIRSFLPTNTILEIAPGFGRCTQFLQKYAEETNIVDLSEVCINACKERFSKQSNINFFVNDGTSLDMIKDNSIDFVFSWDSLVHVEKDVMELYLSQLPRKLKPNGIGFLHHSNIGEYLDNRTGRLTIQNKHWRGESMSAGLFEEFCEKSGLQCINQEIIPWGQEEFNDCLSLFTKKGSSFARLNQITKNSGFPDEKKYIYKMSQNYNFHNDQDFDTHSIHKKLIADRVEYWIENFRNNASKRPIYIWGAGIRGNYMHTLISALGFKAAGFIDIDSSKHFHEVGELTVYPPETIEKDNFTNILPYIVIGTSYVSDVTQELKLMEFNENEDYDSVFPTLLWPLKDFSDFMDKLMSRIAAGLVGVK